MSTATPVWFITACSSGFGEAIAHEALRRGHRVIATARHASRLSGLAAAGATVMSVDVTADDATLAAALQAASEVYGRLTHVVNAAGYVLEGAVEECSHEEVRASYDTNVLGAANITRAAAPYLRSAAAAAGASSPVVVAHFGSLASWEAGPAVAHYCSAKAAVTMLTEGLAEEMRPFGVSAVLIEPGYFRTGFLNTGAAGDAGSVHRVRSARTMAAYEGTAVGERRRALDAVDNHQAGDVAKAARVIVDVFTRSGVAEGRDIPGRLVLGSDTVALVRRKAAEILKQLDEWEAVAKSTDYDEGA